MMDDYCYVGAQNTGAHFKIIIPISKRRATFYNTRDQLTRTRTKGSCNRDGRLLLHRCAEHWSCQKSSEEEEKKVESFLISERGAATHRIKLRTAERAATVPVQSH